MHKSILFGLFVTIFAHPLVSSAQGKYSVTGSYKTTRLDEDGTLDILQLSDTAIKYQVSMITHSGGHTFAGAEGIIPIHGNDAIDARNGVVKCCPLYFHFDKNRVTVTEGKGECCFGFRASTAGTFIKAKRIPDFLSDDDVGYSFRVTTPRAYFYEDSLFTKQKNSYVIAGDTVAERGSTERAIYAEIYNKKRLTLTYGWIPRSELKQLRQQ